MNKEDIVADIDRTLDMVLKNAEIKPIHSYSYYVTLKKMLEQFKKDLDKLVFLKLLDDGWCYEWYVTHESVGLQLICYDVFNEYLNDYTMLYEKQVYELYTLPARMLTVEEFAGLHNAELGTVRQWIRRGKIRTAKKYGNEWRIPALTDAPRRGYTSALYKWTEELAGLPEDFKYLNDYERVYFDQDEDDKKKYYVRFYKDIETEEYAGVKKVLICNAAERERLELVLIGHPAVTYIPNQYDTIVCDIIQAYEKHNQNH